MPRRLILALLSALALAGCGEQRTGLPDVSRPSPPGSFGKPIRSAAAGVSYRAPLRWHIASGAATPLVSSIISGSATLAIWRYSRSEQLPKTDKDLQQARKDLLAAIKLRDPKVRVATSRVTSFRGDHAILVLATEQIAGRTRRVRSLHVFAHQGEVVVDAYAPPEFFPRLDRSVFGPVIKSLRITAPNA